MGWYGFDFDATMAEYEHWRGAGHAGAPIPKMIERVKSYIKQGRDVRIFTARAYYPPNDMVRQNETLVSKAVIEKFCLENFGKVLPITCVKDMSMIALFDDRAVQVIPNTGELVQDKLEEANDTILALNIIIAQLQRKLDRVEELYYRDEEGDDAWASLGDILRTDA